MKKKLSSIFSMILAVTMILSNIIVVHADSVSGSLLKEDRFTDIQSVLIGSGGYITGLVIHPDDPDVMYIRTDVGGAYRWEAETESWTQIMSSFTKDGQYAVDGIAIDPNNKDIVYVCIGNDQPWQYGVSSGIWKSTDRGNTWVDISPSYTLRFHGNSANRGDGECIAVDPNNSDIIWVGTRSMESYRDEAYEAGLHYTTDGGQTWTKKMLYGPYGSQEEVRCVFFDPSSVEDGKSQTIYAVANIMAGGVNVGGLYRSLDAGANWEKVPNEGYTQGETYSATWDVGEEFYKQLKADNGKIINNNYQAGPFTYTMNSWYNYTLGTPAANGTSYQTTITDLSNSKTGYIRSDGNKMIIDKPDTTQYTHSIITFTAPVTGTYSFVPLAISGSNWVTAEGSFYVQDFHVILKKGEETLYEASTGRWSSNIGMTGFNTALTNVSLQTGEKISVHLGGDYESERVMNFDFKVDLIESEPTVLPEATYYHEAHLDSEGRVLMTFGEKRETNTTEASVRGLYRLNTDGTWQNFGVNLPSDGFTTYMSLEVDDTDPDRVAVGVGSGIVNGSGETAWRPPIYYTTDGGRSWTDVTPINADKMASSWKDSGNSAGSVASLVFGEGDEMWMTDWTEVYYTPAVSAATDAARSWCTKIKNIEELVTFSMISPKNGKTNLFTAADLKSAFRISDDKVDVYPTIQAEADRGQFQQADYSAGNPNFIVGAHTSQSYGNGGYVYISEDGGDTWTVASGVNASSTIYPGDAAVSATDTNKLVIATLALGGGSKILYSTDKGATWTEATGSPTGIMPGNMWHSSSPLESDKNKGNVFYVLATGGFYRSEDYGATWTKTSTEPTTGGSTNGLVVTTMEGAPGDVWVSSSAGVWYSSDFGDNFVQIEGLTNGSISLGKGKTDGSYVLYFNGILEDNNKAIYYSEDKGKSFVRITDYNKYSLAKEGKLGASRNTYGRVYIGTGGLGWKYIDAPLDTYNVTKNWNLKDITATGLENIVVSGESFVGTKISDLNYFDAYNFSIDWYSYVRNEITTTQINATENAAGGSGGCTHGAITLMSDGIRMHTDYTNPWHVTFTAPADGLYNLKSTRNLSVSSATEASKFYVTAAGEKLKIGCGGETEINATNYLTAGGNSNVKLQPSCEIELKAGEKIVISGVAGGSSWNTYFTFNFDIELIEKGAHTHAYDNSCDATCNVCGEVRTVEHTFDGDYLNNSENHWKNCSVCGEKGTEEIHSYDNTCDADCNVCGYARTIEHSWNDSWSSDSENHWHVCSVCGETKDTAAHEFDNLCDTTCDICGYERVTEHSWNDSWSSDGENHWFTCSVCGDTNSVGGHAFDNACDTTCDICGYERVTEHSWNDSWSSDSENHWHSCSVCGETKDTIRHVFDNLCDTTCDTCGYERAITHSWKTEWSSDETNHWHSCSVCGAVNDTVAHTFDSISGTVCSSCGYIKNAIETWNMHDELEKGLEALVATGTDYKGTAFSALDLGVFDFNAAYYSKVWTVAPDGFSGGSINGTSNDDNHYKLKLTSDAVQVHGCYSNATHITFTAPKAGKYVIVPTRYLAIQNPVDATVFTISVNGGALAIGQNGETSLNSSATLQPVEIELKAGDKVVVTANGKNSWNTYFTFDFNFALTKDLTPVASWNLYDEFSSNLAALAADGNNYVGTQISALNLGAFKLAPGYYTLVKNLSATAIGGKTTSGTNCHDVLKFSGDNVSIHTCYTNPVNITFTAPKTGAYVIDLSDELTIGGTTLAQTAFEVLVNGESVAKYTAAGAMSDIEVDLNKNDTVVLKVTTGIDSSNWAQTRAIFDCTINLIEEYPVFAGANLTLKSDLSVNFAVMNDWFTTKGYTNPEIRFEVEGVETTVSTYKVQSGRAVFTLSNLSPKQMNDTITATLIATNKDGKRFAYETATYSIAQYCYRQLENSKDAKLKVLCVDVLNYGAATQIFTDYKTDNLANANLTPEQAALATPERAYEDLQNAQSLTENKDKAAPWKGGRLMLTGAITVEFSFETADIAGCYVEFSDGTIVTEDELGYSGGRYVVGYTKCIPANMQEVVSAVVKNANGEVISGTINYSIETYCRSKWNESKDGELTNQAKLCRAMIAYGDGTAAYAG